MQGEQLKSAGSQESSENLQAHQTKAPVDKPLTYGQRAVGLTFNPSGDDSVANCKQGFAERIDQMNDLRNTSTSNEQKRHAAVAITLMEDAQMRAVKALTWKD